MRWRFNSASDSFTMVATKRIAPDGMIYGSYGVRTNMALLHSYGFLDTDLRHD